MDIELNGETAACKSGADTLLKAVLAQLRSHLSHFGQIVSEVVVDGTPITLANEAEFRERRVGEFSLLRVRSVPVEKIVRSILKGLLEALDNLKAKSVAIGTLVREGRRTDALTHMGAFTGDLTFFSDGIHHCCTCLGTDKPAIEMLVTEGLKHLRELLERLRHCIHAETRDSACADLLAVEIPESLEKWRGFLTTATELLTAAPRREDLSRN